MFKEIDLSQAVRSNTVAITFRYQITSCTEKASLVAWLADNVRGENPIAWPVIQVNLQSVCERRKGATTTWPVCSPT